MQSYALRSERSFTKFFMHLNCDLHSPSLLTDQNKALSAHQGVHLSIHMPNCKPPAAVNNVLMRPVIFGTYQEKENYFTSQKNISSRKTLVIRQKAKLAANLFHFVHLLNQTLKTKTANLIWFTIRHNCNSTPTACGEGLKWRAEKYFPQSHLCLLCCCCVFYHLGVQFQHAGFYDSTTVRLVRPVLAPTLNAARSKTDQSMSKQEVPYSMLQYMEHKCRLAWMV